MAIANKPTVSPETQGGGGPLYAETPTIHPRSVKGVFRNLKWYLMVVLLAFWHLAPFLRWDRGVGAPDQAILVDLDGRRAYFFFIEIWPQEVYYLTGLLLLAAIMLFLMSALAGRVWCGFLCFQTVYTDLYVQVERLIVGDRSKRMALERRPWDAYKLVRRGAVNLIWLVIAAACGISFVMYFGDATTVLKEVFTGQAGAGTYSFIGIVGGCCYLLAGFAREQVCIYMCPYSRFQGAMFDEHSLLVTYQDWRGEPRAPARKGKGFEGRGHCIDCKMCVTSCPTGIDIRDGQQMACIGCGLCIDACNTMMDKFGLPRGLITYDSQTRIEARAKGEEVKVKLVRGRTMIYTAIVAVVAAVMIIALGTRSTTEVSALQERSPLFVQLSDGMIRNGYTFKILNKARENRTYTVELAGIEGAVLEVVGEAEGRTQRAELAVEGDKVGTFRVYVSAPEAALKGKTTPLTFVVTEHSENRAIRHQALFAGPEK